MRMFKPTYKYIGRLMLYAFTFPSLISGGCVNENGECVEEPSQEERFNLQFTISTQMGSTGGKSENRTRTADIDGEVPGSVAENYINVEEGDLQFLLFDGERKFLQELTLGEAKVVYTASDYKEYIFHCPVSAQYFKDNIKTTFSFYIMVLANGKSMGMTYPIPAAGSTIEQIVSGLQGNAAGSLLTTKPNPYPLMNVAQWAPQCFPMTGLQKFTVSGPELRKSTEAIPYNISANGKYINMLRALAKIEVIDHANFKGRYNESDYGDDENRIDKVEINGFMNAGSIIPLISEWTNADADETQQVDNPTVPDYAKYLTPVKMSIPVQPNPDNATIDFQPDAYAKSLNEDNCNVFSGYVYEYDIQRLTTDQQVPYIRVTTKGKQSNDDKEGSHVIPMALAEYTNGLAGQPVASLLRNHIYRFQINAINNDANLTVTWTVCPMDQVSVTLPPFN